MSATLFIGAMCFLIFIPMLKAAVSVFHWIIKSLEGIFTTMLFAFMVGLYTDPETTTRIFKGILQFFSGLAP